MTGTFTRLQKPSVANAALMLAMAIAVLMAYWLPLTPDEADRIGQVKSIFSGKPYDFFWPPLSVLVIAINPIDQFDHVMVRLFNLLLTLPIFWLARKHLKLHLNWMPLLLVTPYLAWVASTAMQQGLMLCFLGLIFYTRAAPVWLKACVMALCFAINPSLIAIFSIALFLLYCFDKSHQDLVLASLLGYVLLLPVMAYGYTMTGKFLPMLSSNGPGNLFLGNNPDPLSFRGVGDFEQIVAGFGLPRGTTEVAVVKHFLLTEPTAFVLNLLKKLLFFFSPTDYFRSDVGGLQTHVLFTYIGFCQLIIYGLFLHQWRKYSLSTPAKLALALMVGAWLIYSAFFVKVRFRIPFDFLLFLSVLPQLRTTDFVGGQASTDQPAGTGNL